MRLLTLLTLFTLGWCHLEVASAVDFSRDIRPILSNRCYRCHGPDEQERKGGTEGLRLDTAEGALADLGGYAAVVAGNPDASALLERVSSTDPDLIMPPPEAGPPLSPQQIALLQQWIQTGGNFSQHWSYDPPKRPPLPPVADATWPKNPVDYFLLARLEREGLKPSPQAELRVLARRVSLDLTGLPPSLAELETLLSDPHPDAYERYVDRLLDKPTYGEHWARMWLDLARYADSAGYSDDPPRVIWAYRDYLIRSLNQNKPFDQLTVEQLAGDLLPNPSPDQLMATAFHRNTPTNHEGGTNNEEYRNVAIVDRVNTTLAVWMGTTMACAQCHTHKYDPITQHEYFGMFAFFNNCADAELDDESPLLTFWTDEQSQQRNQLQTELVQAQTDLRTPTADTAPLQAAWEAKAQRGPAWQTLLPNQIQVPPGQGLTLTPGGTFIAQSGAERTQLRLEFPLSASPRVALQLETVEPPAAQDPNAAGAQAFSLRELKLRWKPEAADASEADLPVDLVWANTNASEDNLPGLLTPAADDGRWTPSSGLRSKLVLLPAQTELLSTAGTLVVELDFQPGSLPQNVGLALQTTADVNARYLVQMPAEARQALLTLADERTAAQQATLATYFLETIDPTRQAIRSRVRELEAGLASITPFTVPILQELPESARRKTFVQQRGNFLVLGDEVSAGTPAAFPPLPAEAPKNRLTLARWLVDGKNPLTARVAVNRYWEKLFGLGIVTTPEDFGLQGEYPTHPELLDWLALEFQESGWNTKALLRLLVTSAAYRQASRVTPVLAERDPDNRLLTRGPRLRLEAEVIRDQALFVGGLLSSKRFGPSVQPPQPSLGISAAFGANIDWQTSTGEDRYRRGIYTTWRRSNPYPSMAAFDAPNREVCTLRRPRSNTPLQALVTLNDPVYIEAAQGLARRLIREAGPSTPERLDQAFLLCLSRPPVPAERERMQTLLDHALAHFAAQPGQAETMATQPLGPLPEGTHSTELAAWTVVCNAMLNLDELFMSR